MAVSGSNQSFYEEEDLLKKRIVTEKKRKLTEKTEKNKYREKIKRKVTVPKLKANVKENVHDEEK